MCDLGRSEQQSNTKLIAGLELKFFSRKTPSPPWKNFGGPVEILVDHTRHSGKGLGKPYKLV